MKLTWIESTERNAWRVRKDAKESRPGSAGLMIAGGRFQTMKAFGGCFNELGWDALSALAGSRRGEVIGELFGDEGCGFDFCRMPVGSSDFGLEWYSLNDTNGDYAMKRFSIERDRKILIPYIRSAMKVNPGLKLFASPWSPPAWMKTHKVFNYGTLRQEPKVLKAYALYFVKLVQAYAKEGIPIEQVHFQNEPVADQKFPSCLWTGAQMRDFIRDYLGPAFEKAKLASEIWLGTINSDDYNGYANTVLSDPGAARYVKGIGYQWWGKSCIQRTHQTWPEIPLMQTENECGDGRNTWDYGHYVFDLIWHYLNNGVISYIYWNMVLPAGGESTWGWKQNSMVCVDKDTGRVTYNPEFWVMKHFGRYVKPGAVRLGLKGPWSGNALAFENRGGPVVVVAANPFAERRTMTVGHKGRTWKLGLAAKSFNTLILASSPG